MNDIRFYEEENITITVISKPRPLTVAVIIATQIAMMATAILVGDMAAKVLAVTGTALAVIWMAYLLAVRRHGLTIAEARRELDRIEDFQDC